MSAVEFFLPTLPPSKNDLRMIARGRLVSTPEYRAWRKSAGWEMKLQRVRSIKGPYRLTIQARRPALVRRRDLANMLEATEDLLTVMEIIEDDHLSQHIELDWTTDIAAGVRIRVESTDLV